MYTIEKTYDFDLAHRVDMQCLDERFCDPGKAVQGRSLNRCLGLHGHGAKVKIKLSSEQLVKDMVLDYNEIGWMKKFIGQYLDHCTVIRYQDELYKYLVKYPYNDVFGKQVELVKSEEYSTDDFTVYKLNLTDMPECGSLAGYLESVTVVDFVTASENFSKWIYQIVEKRVKQYNEAHGTDVRVVSCSYLETESSEATYVG